MFESLGPAVPGSLVMEDRKADLLPYLSGEAQWSWISFAEGHPGLGDVLGCRKCWVSSGSPAPAIWDGAGLVGGDGESRFPCLVLHRQKQVQWGTWGIKANHLVPWLPDATEGPGVATDKPPVSTGVSSH